jgi:hypothetical protein
MRCTTGAVIGSGSSRRRRLRETRRGNHNSGAETHGSWRQEGLALAFELQNELPDIESAMPRTRTPVPCTIVAVLIALVALVSAASAGRVRPSRQE